MCYKFQHFNLIIEDFKGWGSFLSPPPKIPILKKAQDR